MDEKTTDAVLSESEEGAPPSEPSQETTEQHSPGSDAQLESALQRISALEGRLSGEQSKADKLEAQMTKQYKNLSEEIKKYEDWRQAGKSPDEAQREVLIDQVLQDYQKTPESTEVSQQATVADEAHLSSILTATGLEDTDPDVIDILRKDNDPMRQILDISALATSRKQAQETPPSPGAVLPMGGGETVETENLASITKELQAELEKPASPNRRERVRELRKKHAELLPKE